MKVVMGIADKETARMTTKEVTVSADEGIRPIPPTRESRNPPAIEAGRIAAGNASQFSDGASPVS